MDRRIERTRRAVVTATVDLVGREGSHVGMTEIAQAAGVSRKAVYENFGSREQVLYQTTVSLLRRELPAYAGVIAQDGKVLERLTRDVVEHLSQYRNYYCAVLSGPGSYMVTTALADQLGAAFRQPRVAQPWTSGGSLCDRFRIHGLLGVLTEALVQHETANLHVVVARLQRDMLAPRVALA